MTPLYDFKCRECGNVDEHLRPTADPTASCLSCGGLSERIMSAPHLLPDGVYSHTPNMGDQSKFDRRYEEACERGRRVKG